jgi:hypothetical protein
MAPDKNSCEVQSFYQVKVPVVKMSSKVKLTGNAASSTNERSAGKTDTIAMITSG